MKNKLFIIIAFFFSINIFQMNNVNATTCAPSFSKIGVVDKILKYDSHAEIFLKNYYIFDEYDWNITNSNETVNIKKYEDIAEAYLNKKLQFLKTPQPQFTSFANIIFISLDALNKIGIKVGDLTINGPPYHNCGYGFIGLLSKEGKLVKIAINDNFQSYSYENNNLSLDPGQEISCDNKVCQVKVDFILNNESFTLSPGQSYNLNTGPIKSVYLLDSSNPKKSLKDFSYSDFNKYATYVLDLFEYSNSPTQINPEEQVQDQSIIEKISIFFDKLWNGFLSLFR